jgi:uncharacterized protein Yka (UPF0111/DUF47 family)
MPVTATVQAGGKPTWKPITTDVASSPFLIDAKSWYAINVYVLNGIRLPSDMPYADINGAYALVRAHTTTWRDVSFPKTISVADDIVDYASKAPRLYQALLDASNALDGLKTGTPAFDEQKRRMLTILDRLIGEATKHAVNTKAVKDMVLEFRSQTASDHVTVQSINTYYLGQFGAQSDKSKEMVKEIAALHDAIDDMNREYDKAVITAATSPTYAWIFPFGTIAAAVVAGIFSDQAIKLKKQIEKARDALGTMEAEQKRRMELLALLATSSKSTSGIEKLMGPACDALDKIAGTWSAISADMAHLKTLVAGMTDYSMQFIDVPQAIDNWKALGIKADAYRANAFINEVAA